MKQILGLDTGTVIFTPGAAGVGTLVFSGISGFNAARVLAITNVTRKAMIYAAEVSGKAGAWSSVSNSGGTLTLDADTSAHSSGDIIRPLYSSDEKASPLSHEDYARLDGVPLSVTSRYAGAWTSANTVGVTTYFTVGGESYYLKHLMLSSTRYSRYNLTMLMMPQIAGGIDTNAFNYRGAVDNQHMIDVGQFLPHSTRMQLSTEKGDGYQTEIDAFATGYRMACDFNFKARKTALWIGDSITRGTSLADFYLHPPTDLYTFIVRDWLVTNKYDYRLITKANSGWKSAHILNMMQCGELETSDRNRVGLVFYQIGINDLDPAVSLTGLQTFVPWALTTYPGARIVVLGTTPMQLSAYNTYAITIRSNYSGYVTSLASSRVSYVDLGTAFDRTIDANFVPAESGGNGVHPAWAVQSNIASLITTHLQTVSIP